MDEMETRTVTLPGGRTLVIRPVVPADADALAGLYGRLSDEDIYRRFFSMYHPGRKVFEGWAAEEGDDRWHLVAVVGDRLVADAACVRLPNGNGEFALVVDPEWRGWLGPYLLDTLCADAAARGIPNLQADILTTNGPMMALVRARGFAVVSHPDFSETQVTVGAATRTPGWSPRHDRPRVLVEISGGHAIPLPA